ncbi:RNA polymerase sigma-70 factor (ECF subfamily) [Psychromicrobium silvestre]|uniref:RNA polymerase sigma-70 factor (ECF subfamily) n=1 Tax=Psychromicrobium silvestre TaxID=1645614 RepID=A0A7Y9LRT0_9MICC|nr:zf-HC2 domain-containing protein [Psychromicrobium silvestre]NYE94411.1 RNA polymerase sigma-70 factor (ECF subfamily) [Psychromicrobium silvestre]
MSHTDPSGRTPDRYADWDAAYVLGSLSSAERHEFEKHLEDCPRCAVAVAELAGLPGLLSTLPESTVTELGVSNLPETARAPQKPAVALPKLAHQARRSKIRRRFAAAAVAAAVAASAAGITAALIPHTETSQAQAAGVPLSFSNVDANSVAVTGQALSVAWGTQIEWKCSYQGTPQSSGYEGPKPFELVVIDKQGKETVAASWDAQEDSVVSPVATVLTPIGQIAQIEVRWTNSGKVVVRAVL